MSKSLFENNQILILLVIILFVGFVVADRMKEEIDRLGPENFKWGPDFQGIDWMILGIASISLLMVGAWRFRSIYPSLGGGENV